jgi:hypothetical protein
MYDQGATKHSAGLFGLSLEELPDEIIPIWDMNYNTFRMFDALRTQWRVGMGGAIGIDYGVIRDVGKMLGLKNKEINEMFPDLQVMENEALITMRENEKDANDS